MTKFPKLVGKEEKEQEKEEERAEAAVATAAAADSKIAQGATCNMR